MADSNDLIDDIKLLNKSGVHIVMMRDSAGNSMPIDTDTIRFCAALVRAFNKTTPDSEKK